MNETKKNNTHKKHLKWLLHIWKLRIYITWDFRLKNSQMRDQKRNHHGIVELKKEKWKETNGTCECCGKKIGKFNLSELHHIINWYRIPQLETDKRNLQILCHDCHKMIHKEPFLQVKEIRKKCKQLGVDYKQFYKV